ncbi:hypothetical protein ACFVUY_38175 [Kitasatospora sp. NPDC058063]|uniref:hypothetical protein n=1 Tax=unclassified Kitasatospora TaxID=2633591 RepID=UPI0036D93BFD
MRITTNQSSGTEQPSAGTAPAMRPEPGTAAEAFQPITSSVGLDLVRAVSEASRAVSALGEVSDRDVSVSALTAVECTGSTPAGALFAAADVLRCGETLTVHGLLWARVPGPSDRDPWHWRVTLLVSALDPEFGEADAPAHQAEPSTCRVALYLDADAEMPEGALTAIQREALTPAGALRRAAETVRECAALEVEGLIWARVAARHPGAWEYRLTVLATSTPSKYGEQGRPTYFSEEQW